MKCLARSKGPRLLILKVSRALTGSICEGDFSGWRMPGMQKARRRWFLEAGKREEQWEAAVEMVDSSR